MAGPVPGQQPQGGPQMVLCGVVVNADGSVAATGPLDQVAGNILPAGFGGKGPMDGKGFAMDGKGFGGKGPMDGFGGKGPMPGGPMAFGPMGPGMMMGKGASKGPPRTEDDWSNVRQQQSSPEPGNLNYIFEQSRNAQPDAWFGKGAGAPQIPQSFQPPPDPVVKRPGHYVGLFAEPTTDADWGDLGRQRGALQDEEGEAEVDASEAPEDKEWAELFEGSEQVDGKERSSLLAELKTKSAPDGKAGDWADPVPDEELKWHARAAANAKTAAKKILEPSSTRRVLAAERVSHSSSIPARTSQASVESEPRNDDEARITARAEELRSLAAMEAKEQRQRDLEAAKRQAERDAERESKRASGEQQVPTAAYKPKRPDGEDVPASKFDRGEEAFLTNDEYRAKQAEDARKLREMELKVREEQKKRDEQRAAQRSASPEVEEGQSKPVYKARPSAEVPAASASASGEDYRARQAAEAKQLREMELKVRKEQEERDAKRAMAEAEPGRPGGKVYKAPVGKYSGVGLGGPAGPGPSGPGRGKGYGAPGGYGAPKGKGYGKGFGAPNGYESAFPAYPNGPGGYGPLNGYGPGPGFEKGYGPGPGFGPGAPGPGFGGAAMGPMGPMGSMGGPMAPGPGPYPGMPMGMQMGKGFGPPGGPMGKGFGPAPFPGYDPNRQRSTSRSRTQPAPREPYLDAEAYREKQAEDAREQRRLELEQIEAQKKLFADREAQRQANLAA